MKIYKLKDIIGKYIFGYNDEKLEVIIGNLLKKNKLTLSLAESCTGGTISSLLHRYLHRQNITKVGS